MSNPCERCKKWDDFYYWNHTNDQDKYFFKVIFGDLRQGMIIPNKFAQNFKGAISETIKLEARNGSICNVQVTKNSDKLVLGHGWEAFVTAHDLKNTDFLVFRYSGDSHFKVLIFDASGCEKSSSCVLLSNLMNNAEARQEDPVQLPRSSNHDHDHPAQTPRNEGRTRPQRDCLSRRKKIIEVASSSGHSDANLMNNAEARQEDSVQLPRSSNHDHDHPAQTPRNEGRTRPQRVCLSRRKKIIEVASSSSHSDAIGDASSSESEDDQNAVQEDAWCQRDDIEECRVRLFGCIFAWRTRLTRARTKEVEEKVRAIGSEFPVFGAVMTKHKVSCSYAALTFCREYARKWLPHEDQTVSLHRHGRSWNVQFHTNRKSKASTLNRGWGQFVGDNGVRAGDICLFELLKNTTMCAMNVHIIRQEHHG